MKRLYQSLKYLRHSRRIIRKRIKRKTKTKRKNKAFGRSIQGQSIQNVRNLKQRRHQIPVVAPTNFSFLKYPEGVTRFIDDIEHIFEKKKPIFIDMHKVEQIDYGAIASLLSVMYLFKSEKIGFNGNFPANVNLAKILHESGFLSNLFENKTDKARYSINKENQIITQADSQLATELAKKVIEDSSQSIWDSPRSCRGLYRVIIELIDNTHEHAAKKSKDSKRWWLSVNHDKENKKVSYVFIDYGIGIFKSIASKPSESRFSRFFDTVKQKVGLDASGEHLRLLLTTKIQSQNYSEKKGRGLGIYGIHQTMKRNQISNLHVISNNAYGNASQNEYRRLGTGFNGTLYYWELCYTNVNSKWIFT